MLPSNELSSVSVPSEFLDPDDERTAPLIAKELGGVGLSDPSQGLQVQVWTAKYLDGDVVVGSATVADAVQFSRPDVVEIDLAFDQNMFPAVAFTQLNGEAQEGWLWWFSTLDNDHIFTQIPGAYDLRVTMDDKRGMSSGQNDIILAYLKDDNLYFRAQRDRFDVEYLLRENVGGRLKRFGMNDGLRVQFEVLLFNDAPDLTLLVGGDDAYVIEDFSLAVAADEDFTTVDDPDYLVDPETALAVSADPDIVVPNEDKTECL